MVFDVLRGLGAAEDFYFIQIKMYLRSNYALRLFTVMLAVAAQPAGSAPAVSSAGSGPADGSRVFMESVGAEIVLPLSVAIPADGAPRVRDYAGREVEAKVALSPDRRRVLGFTPALSRGFYEIVLAADGSDATGFIVHGASAPSASDPFFAIDSAISWLTKPAERAELINGLPSLGIGLSRERLSWNAIHPAADRREWETPRVYDTTRRHYAASNVKILEMFHDAPKWLGAAQGGRFPDDLIGAAASWREIAARWHDTWSALEVWNEPDIIFGGNQPADQYLPLVKTIRHTMRSAGIELPILGGAIAYLNRDYLEVAARNGLLDESEAFSFHYYGDPLGMEKHIAEIRTWLRAHGAEGKALWLTECGNRWMGDAAARPSLSDQSSTALAFGMNTVEAKACGIEAFFPFVYVRYNEGPKNFGMLDASGAPLRSMAAYAQALRALSGASYVGDIAASEIPSARRIRVFERGDEDAVVVVYTGDTKPEGALVVPFAVVEARGIDGRALVVGADSRIPCVDGMAYLRVRRGDIADRLNRDTEAARLSRVRLQAPSLPEVAHIVLQPVIDIAKVTASSRGYYLPEQLDSLDLELRVNNFSTRPAKVTLRPDHGAAIDLEVPATARTKHALKIQVADLSASADGVAYYTVKAEAEDGGRVSSVVLPFILPQGLQKHLQGAAYQFNLPIAELHRWRMNNAAAKARFIPRGAEVAWGLEVKFSQEAERWAYPPFTLPQEVDLDRVQGVLLRARAQPGAAVRLMTWSGKDEPRHTNFPVIPADGQWHVAYVPFTSFMNAEAGKPVGHALRQISVGFNSKEASALLEVSDLYLLGR